jgi:hypothetical protein
MVANNEETTSPRDHTDDDNDKEMHKRKRALTRKLDLRIIPLLSCVF